MRRGGCLAVNRYRHPRSHYRRPSIPRRPSDDEIRQKIAELKARKPVAEPAPDGFHYNPDEPLRLINPDKRNSYD